MADQQDQEALRVNAVKALNYKIQKGQHAAVQKAINEFVTILETQDELNDDEFRQRCTKLFFSLFEDGFIVGASAAFNAGKLGYRLDVKHLDDGDSGVKTLETIHEEESDNVDRHAEAGSDREPSEGDAGQPGQG